MRGYLALVVAVFGLAEAGTAQARAGGPATVRVAIPSLSDAAVAVADPVRPVIYYNPSALRALGSDIAAFLLAHEEGHIYYGHRPPHTGRMSKAEGHALLQGYEREADCYAARRLATDRPGAVLAAIAYFRRLDSERADQDHPTGRERGGTIAACLEAEPPVATVVGAGSDRR